MNEVTVPYHLLIPTLLTLCGLIIITAKRKKLFRDPKSKLFWFSVVCFLVVYLLIVGSAAFLTIYNQWALNQFDLNNDGFFQKTEITDQQHIAMKKVIGDNGRNFSFIFGAVSSQILASIIYMIGRIYLSVKSKISLCNNHT